MRRAPTCTDLDESPSRKLQSLASQADLEDYKKWLQETGRIQNGAPHDNMMNRTLF